MKLAKALLMGGVLLFSLTGCIKDETAIITVNDKPITQSQYDEAYKLETSSPQYQQFESFLKDENGMMSLMLRDRIVNELVLKEIINQEVEKRGIEITKEEIQKRKDEIIEKLGSKEKMDELLSQNGISNKKFEEDIKSELKIDKLIKATKNVDVTDKEVKDFYNQNKAQFNFPERVRASHILIDVNPAQIKQEIISQDKKGTLTSDEIEKKTQEEIDKKMELAKEVRQKAAQNPKDFAKLAEKYSADKASASRGGDLGFFSREQMVKPFSDAAFSLKPGVISEVVVSDYGDHIIMVTDRAQAGIQPFDKMKDEIKTYLEQKKKIDTLQGLLDGLKASSKVEYKTDKYNPESIQKLIKEKAKATKENTLDKADKKPEQK